ncbi:hypothetical protein [Dyella sp. ASV21]|uniref:hypothetical protein n=1 Tax=Dyella sp. ASV21 TaxID=2795114 RepID=UPI0018EC8C9D|nr:hypothetical protein [Dyella sp. ASV21]
MTEDGGTVALTRNESGKNGMPWTTSYADTLRDFELEAIRGLATGVLSKEQLEGLKSLKTSARYEYTGSGYFLTVADPGLPSERKTLSVPPLIGIADDVICGFIVFLGQHELTLECHTWGAVEVPADFRQRNVLVDEPSPENFIKPL